jgi:hypothetical protein
MIPRTELESLTFPELRRLAQQYGITPIGVKLNDREAWIKTLSNFGYVAIDQLRNGNGLKYPYNLAEFCNYQDVGVWGSSKTPHRDSREYTDSPSSI